MSNISENSDVLNLVQKAQQGCRQSMDSLTQQANGRMFAYIYRLTLNRDTAEDLQQETLLEMVKSIKRLRKPHLFWSWLYRIALSKVQHHYRKEKAQTISPAERERLLQQSLQGNDDELKNLINKELAEAVIDAVSKLKFRHRNILILRCYEQLSYSEIAKITGHSQSAAQVSFYRAKHLLKRKLSRSGFNKGMLIIALGLFGRMTTPANAAVVAVSANSIKVGVAATVIGAAGTNLGLGIAAMLTAVVIGLGSVTMNNNIAAFGSGKTPGRAEVKSFHYVQQAWDKTGSPNPNLNTGRSLSKGAYEQWHYFPEGIEGPMFMMMQRWDPQQKNKLCGWLQNGSGNYYYHSGQQTIYLYNYHLPMRYMNTRRLPSDEPEFTAFLDQVEGSEAEGLEYVRDPKTGLLTGVLDNRFFNAEKFESSFSYNTLTEKSFDSFRYPWPQDAPVVDERDEMHKRGWTYFYITGQINDKQVHGSGRIPFVYNSYKENPPWLKLNIGEELKIIDCQYGAYLTVSDEKLIAAYPAGSFFKGLTQPWMGMHTIDVIRRDAAQKRITFSIENFGADNEHYGKAGITFSGSSQMVCTVDIDRDVIEKIEFFNTDTAENSLTGTLEFTYLEELEKPTSVFAEPAEIKASKSYYQESMGILWLMELAQETLGQ